MPLLEARAVSHRYGDRVVLNDVTLGLHAGQVVAVLGPNAAGKTTLLRILSGILRPTAGKVYLGEREISGVPRRDVARKLAVVPQEFLTAFPFSVAETVGLGRAPHLGPLGSEGDQDRLACEQAIEKFELGDLSKRSFATLSGGEKQRVLLARAVAQACDIILLDEPTAHMDLGHRLRTLEWLREWVGAAPQTRAALLISHDLVLAARYVDEVALLAKGQLVAQGTPERVLTEERIREVYGVEARVSVDAQGTLIIAPTHSRNGFGFGYSPDRNGSD